MKKIALIIVLIVSLFTACNKEERSSVVSWQNDYYPVKINSWISYQIEDIAIDKESAVNDTIKYQIKDVIASCIEENEHYKSYRIETYKRMHDKSNWEHWKNWELKVYPRAIHTIKDNVEKVVLLNPVRLKDKWDGNAYNTEEEKQYELDALKDSIWNGDLKKIARVKHADVYDLIEKITSFDEFAKGIGLINKTDINVQLNIDPDKPWEQKITKGTIYYQTFLAFGDE